MGSPPIFPNVFKTQAEGRFAPPDRRGEARTWHWEKVEGEKNALFLTWLIDQALAI